MTDNNNVLGTLGVLLDVGLECSDQDAEHGEQNHAVTSPNSSTLEYYACMADQWKACNDERAEKGTLTWDGILLEEVYEALSAPDSANRRAEFIQVAAVAVAIVECIDRNEVE